MLFICDTCKKTRSTDNGCLIIHGTDKKICKQCIKELQKKGLIREVNNPKA